MPQYRIHPRRYRVWLGGGCVTVSDSDAFQKTYAEVSWDSVVQQAVAQAGDGDQNGMISELVEAADTPAIGASFRMAAVPLAEETSIANLVLSITFTGGYVDDASGVAINSGKMEFTLTATKTPPDASAATTETRYDVTSYTATTVALSMTSADSTAKATVTADTITSSTVLMTVTVEAEVTAGTSIKDATATNVSLEVSASTSGSVTVNDSVHDAEEVKPETPIAEPEIGSEERPYEVASEADIEKIASMIDNPSETFYVRLVKDIVLKVNHDAATIVVPKNYNIDIDLNGLNISRKSDTAPSDDSTPKSVGDDSRYIFDVYGNLTIKNGSLGGTLFNNPSARMIQVFSGSLTLDEVTVSTYSNDSGAGAGIWIEGGKLSLKDCTFYSSSVCVNIRLSDIPIEAEISGCHLYNMATNQMKGWAYCLINYGNLKIRDTEVWGMQGAISCSGPESYIEDGTVAVTSSKVFDYMPDDYRTYYNNWDNSPNDNHEIQNGEIFHAFYTDGGGANPTITYISGGTFRTESTMSTLQVGNTTYGDGGGPYDSYVYISGGTFENTTETGKILVDFDDNPPYSEDPNSFGYGKCIVTGGTFNSPSADMQASLEEFVDTENYQINGSDGSYTVTSR